MKVWEATPLVGINGITFGMPRKEVRKLWGPQFREFKKSSFSRNSADDYGIAHVYYDENNMCNAVEVFNDVIVLIEGKTIFPNEIEEALKIIPDLIDENGTYVSVEKSVGICMLEGKMECILLGAYGYYR